MGLLASLLVAASCPPDAPHVAVFQARNVAAADAAQAVNGFAARYGLRVAAASDPAANTVRVEGDAAPVQRAGELLAGLDRRPPQVRCELLFVQLPAGFAEAVGLGEADGGRWVLSRRESRMLTAAVDRTVRQRAGADVLSRPSLVVVDNQTGFIQVGHDGGDRLVARVTPRVAPGGSVLVRLESQIADPGAGDGAAVRTVYEVQTTAALAAGETVVVRVPLAAAAGRPAAELLVLATAHRVASDEDR